jgi:hypothetical protein
MATARRTTLAAPPVKISGVSIPVPGGSGSRIGFMGLGFATNLLWYG